MVKCFDTISKLRAYHPDSELCEIVRGYYSPGDGGGGYFVWHEISPEFEDFGTIIKPDTDRAKGCWRRIFDDFVSIRWFGAKGDTKGSAGEFKGNVKSGELVATEPLFSSFGPENGIRNDPEVASY